MHTLAVVVLSLAVAYTYAGAIGYGGWGGDDGSWNGDDGSWGGDGGDGGWDGDNGAWHGDGGAWNGDDGSWNNGNDGSWDDGNDGSWNDGNDGGWNGDNGAWHGDGGAGSARGALEGALGGQWIPDTAPVHGAGYLGGPAPFVAAAPVAVGWAGAGYGYGASRGSLEGALGGQWIPDTQGHGH